MRLNLRPHTPHILCRSILAGCIVLAAMTLTSCLALSNLAPDRYQPRFWMRAEAYRTAAAVAVAQSDIDRNDPSLIARDFTLTFSHVEDGHNVDNYMPCPLAGSQLFGADKRNCSLSPGPGGVSEDDPRCPWQTCAIVSVRSETWADRVARQAILSTLADFNKVCADALAYGPNKRFDAVAAHCSRPDQASIHLAVEIKQRLFQPCVYKELRRGERLFYQPICTNPEAALFVLN